MRESILTARFPVFFLFRFDSGEKKSWRQIDQTEAQAVFIHEQLHMLIAILPLRRKPREQIIQKKALLIGAQYLEIKV